MAIQIQGSGGVVAEVDGTTFRALRVVVRPTDYGSLGSFAASHLSGTMAAGLAANAEIFQFRWSDATRLALIHGLSIDGLAGSATAFTAGFAKIDALIARAWTVDGSGGTGITMTGNNQKLRTTMGASLVGAIRGSSTAALTAGTKTLDGAPVGLSSFSIGTAVSVNYQGRVTLYGDIGSAFHTHPVVLAQNEGMVARATVPATGTWQFGASITWSEVVAY